MLVLAIQMDATLDDLGIKPSILKIDAEGFDYQVLLGARDTIQTSKPFIALEISWADMDTIKTFMDEYQYTLLAYDINNDCFSNTLDSVNSRASLHNNLFAVPLERMGTIPIC